MRKGWTLDSVIEEVSVTFGYECQAGQGCKQINCWNSPAQAWVLPKIVPCSPFPLLAFIKVYKWNHRYKTKDLCP